ncbi:hypothetical protein [Streptomyces soliscabiei]|uniref:hypothetical protein n=1 Tax=Streptomyces soliscabiei TaxID=588897 RepID=UPI0029B91959|nr:hypothetical protein [Streptomyces sp. NY05-11A]MDX2682442.1 hypothetical protein [Streptomyces sp. NY05-11A]
MKAHDECTSSDRGSAPIRAPEPRLAYGIPAALVLALLATARSFRLAAQAPSLTAGTISR